MWQVRFRATPGAETASGRSAGTAMTWHTPNKESPVADKSSKPSASGNQRGRSAISGRFVKQATVRRHPATTVNEQVKPKPKKQK